jgi:hypothetical protein
LALQQDLQNLAGLFLELDLHALLAQFACREVQLKHSKANTAF